jgi:hypothetical protein
MEVINASYRGNYHNLVMHEQPPSTVMHHHASLAAMFNNYCNIFEFLLIIK